MSNTNFHLAPPAGMVDGLMAVPIDIQAADVTLTFDGATEAGTGDATLDFTVGPDEGNPIFDLRQTISAAWLDGNPIPLDKMEHHYFGGGWRSGLRVLESVLAAGSTHTLRLTYELGPPNSPLSGYYPPAMTWDDGPRLVFNFGMSDLYPARFLEAWIPSNLIFDQVDLNLTLEILNTSIPHTLITNGSASETGDNKWLVNFPPSMTAMSPLVEIRATDTLASMIDTVTLPVSGKTVTIETWKLVTSEIDLAEQVENLKIWLSDNENSTGPYLHGDRYVAFMHVGGMEYDGATTSEPDALRHEAFHSWWGRGLKPASQPDAWFDEAWTMYNDYGAAATLPFDFSEPAAPLNPLNPWVRITSLDSYWQGMRFWEGVADLIGVDTLNDLMGEFYRERHTRPATTTDIEEFLFLKTGNPTLVDAFHRFVFGFTDNSNVPDLWFRDAPAHGGGDAWNGAFWDSPDIWIRNDDDDIEEHQAPRWGKTNWFYASVRNRSTTAEALHFMVAFTVKNFAGTEFVYPGDFLPPTAVVADFVIPPGEHKIVKAPWHKASPQGGGHPCILASVFARLNHPGEGTHVWEQSNLAQKNLTVERIEPGDWRIYIFLVENQWGLRARRFWLELHRPKGHSRIEVGLIQHGFEKPLTGRDVCVKEVVVKPHPALTVRPVRLGCGGVISPAYGRRARDLTKPITSRHPERLSLWFGKPVEALFPKGRTSRLPVSLRPHDQRMLGLRIRVPEDAKPGDILRFDLAKRDGRSGKVLGGIAFEVQVRRRPRSRGKSGPE